MTDKSDQFIPPWEAGYKAPEETPRTRADHIKSVAHLGGLATQRNKRLRAQGFVVKSAAERKYEKSLQPKVPGTRGNPDPNSKTSLKVALKTGDRLSESQKDFAIRFCHQYIRDFNVINAWLRCGGNPNTPTAAREMIRWPFVQEYLAQIGDHMEEADLCTRSEIILGLKKEAHNENPETSSHSARVSAWGKLARIRQMDVQVSKSEVTHKGGVMVVPAGPATMEDWESNTVEGQAQLKTDVTK